MRRRLTPREVMLLIVLLALAAGSAYYMFFFRPNRAEKESVEAQIVQTEDIIQADQIRLVRKQEMEKALEEVFANDPDPASMAPYDNGRVVMHELNSVLAAARDYSLSFSVAASPESADVVRRTVSMNFTCSSYDQARSILQRLHDSHYRCLFANLSLSFRDVNESYSDSWWFEYITNFTDRLPTEPDTAYTEVSVSATLVFFEYTGADGTDQSSVPDSWASDTVISGDAETAAPQGPAAPAVETGYTGWADNDQGLRFYFRDGQMVTDEWIDGVYYIQSNGVLATGFQFVDTPEASGFYMFAKQDPDMGRILTGWQDLSEGNTGWFEPDPGTGHYGQCTWTTAWGQFDSNYRPVF